MTTATTLTIQQQAAMVHIFTLHFKAGEIAVLEVRGAADQDSARQVAQQAIKHRRHIGLHGEVIEEPISYTVSDGDTTGGRTEHFYLWCSAAAQEQQPHPAHSLKAQRRREAEGKQEVNN
jgi:hypothetical protein